MKKVKPENMKEVIEHGINGMVLYRDSEMLYKEGERAYSKLYDEGYKLVWGRNKTRPECVDITKDTINVDNWWLLIAEKVQKWPGKPETLNCFIYPHGPSLVRIDYSTQIINIPARKNQDSGKKFICNGFQHKGLLNGAFASQAIMWTDRKGNFNECETGVFQHRSLATHAIMEEVKDEK